MEEVSSGTTLFFPVEEEVEEFEDVGPIPVLSLDRYLSGQCTQSMGLEVLLLLEGGGMEIAATWWTPRAGFRWLAGART